MAACNVHVRCIAVSACLLQAEKLLKHGSGNDTLLVTIWNKIGDHHADRHKWHKVGSSLFCFST